MECTYYYYFTKHNVNGEVIEKEHVTTNYFVAMRRGNGYCISNKELDEMCAKYFAEIILEHPEDFWYK